MSRFNDLLNKKAVALKYDERQSAAPIVVASGMGYVAEKMVEVANESGVPVYEDNSLATVLSQLNLGTEIPEELYKAVVDIYSSTSAIAGWSVVALLQNLASPIMF